MGTPIEEINKCYKEFTDKLSELFTAKKKLIIDFRKNLEEKKISKLRDDLMNSGK